MRLSPSLCALGFCTLAGTASAASLEIEGLWADPSTRCRDITPDSDIATLVHVDAKGVGFYEMSCTFDRVRREEKKVTAKVTCKGEGLTDHDEMTFTRHGKLLDLRFKKNHRANATNLHLCPEPSAAGTKAK
jgi:hypothetical protein